MNLLSELEGLSGENLCSAVLRLLLIRSQDLRDSFINLLSRECRSGPITSGSDFSCALEQPTEDSGRWGRLDLLLETGDAVIGLENKLYAEFQEGQPHKYVDTITKRAVGLTNLRQRKYRAVVAVLAPQSRSTEVKGVIGADDRFLSIDWEEVLELLRQVGEGLDPTTSVLLHSLDRYIQQQIALFPDFARWIPHIQRRFDSRGTPLQQELVGKIWQFFPDPGRRLSYGDTWCGYYFTDAKAGTRGWYGFVPKAELSQGARNEAELIIATSFDVPFQDPPFHQVELVVGPRFIGANEIHVWSIDYDEAWAKPDAWTKYLKPLHESYAHIKEGQEDQHS